MKATVNQTATENVNEVMDARIVKLNELKSVKMANLSKGKRPAAKEAKLQATYILENWDNEFELVKMLNDSEVTNDDIKSILASRLENFADAKEACKKAVEEANQAEAPKKEKKTKVTKAQKDLIEKATKSKKVTVEVEKGAGKSATAKKAQPKAEEKKATKKAEPKKEEAKAPSAPKSTKKVGDIHKNGKWMWTEYQPGKFDWRTIPTMTQKTGAKPKVETEGKKAEKKQTTTKSDKASKGNAKQTKKGEPKKNSPEAPKVLTIDEFIALPVKTAKTNKKPSPAQAEALKLINKGYRITSDKKFFEKDNDRKSCNWDSVTAMFKRYGIDYIPEGLIKK